ncbi:MAG: choice-of-anchor Q domain-containing protein [Chloroflexota bacterium]
MMISTPNSTSQAIFKFIVIFGLPLSLALIMFSALTPSSIEAAVNCTDSSWSVGTEADLNSAIGCFNGKSTSGVYTIALSQYITLTASTAAINNPIDGISLMLDGGRNVLDGQNISGVRPLQIMTDTVVTLQNIVITNGNAGSDFGGGILNWGELDIVNTAIASNTAEHGGGIANYGPLNISTSTVSDNSATEDGGGVLNLTAPLSVTNSSIYSNTAVIFGGGIASNGLLTITQSVLYQNSANSGGGLYTGDSASIQNSTLSGNIANVSGGAIYLTGTLNIDSGTLSGNSASSGGAFFGVGTINMQNSIVDAGSTGSNCFATVSISSNGYNLDSDGSCNLSSFGDISNQDPFLDSLQENGGIALSHALLEGSPAINAGFTTLTEDQRGIGRPRGGVEDIGAYEYVPDCAANPWSVSDEASLNAAIVCFNDQSIAAAFTITLTQNISLTKSTPEILNQTAGISLVIQGNNYTVDGQDISGVRPFEIAPSTAIAIQDLTIMQGNANDDGGAIHNDGVATLTNSILYKNVSTGEGGAVYNRGQLTVSSSAIHNNSADDDGGGISNFGGEMTIISSTLSHNASSSDGGAILTNGWMTITHSALYSNTAASIGGGIYNRSILTVTNSTISSNTAGSEGGGVAQRRNNTWLMNSTVANNSAPAGGGIHVSSDDFTLDNTIVANNSDGNDCSGSIVSAGYNLDSDGSCNLNSTGDLSSQDPMLGPLQANGSGTTFTHALLEGSPAIDAGNTALADDQRSVARPQNNGDDIGAFEREISEPIAPDQYDLFLPFMTNP